MAIQIGFVGAHLDAVRTPGGNSACYSFHLDGKLTSVSNASDRNCGGFAASGPDNFLDT